MNDWAKITLARRIIRAITRKYSIKDYTLGEDLVVDIDIYDMQFENIQWGLVQESLDCQCYLLAGFVLDGVTKLEGLSNYVRVTLTPCF